MRMRIIFLAALCLSLSPITLSSERTNAETIRDAAQTFLAEWSRTLAAEGYTSRYEVGAIDSRIALAACNQGLNAEFAGDPLQTTSPSVLVSCSGERPWRMYVTTSVEVHGPALIAARPLARGERLFDKPDQCLQRHRPRIGDLQLLRNRLQRSADAADVVVQPGDTLWGIASALAPEGDPRALVDQLSDLAGGSQIQPGQQLVVPVHWLD